MPPQSGPRRIESQKKPQSYLSFDLLEDVMLLPPSRYEEIVERTTVARIGPLVEYAYHHYGDAAKPLRGLADQQAVSAFTRALQVPDLSMMPHDTSLQARPIEFCKVPVANEGVEEPNWMAFCMRLADAGVKAGLSKQFSQALAGTFEEMTGNLMEHSEHPNTGIVGYRWRVGEFEYVVADAGIGVLDSLREHEDYSWLSDAGEALATAVSDGESRHGRRQLRGFGFHRLIFNIAERNSYLRFRSGDHSYAIDGTKPALLKKTQHCAHFQGFLISVVSRPLNRELINRA
jgi:hypothetical protein